MAKTPIILGIENTSSLAWSASQIFVDRLAQQLSRDAQHHLYFIVVGPELVPTALTALADQSGWNLDVAYGTLTEAKASKVKVPKKVFPDTALSFDDKEGVLTLTPTGTGQPRSITVAEVVRAVIKVENAGRTAVPEAKFPGLHIRFDASKSTEIPEKVTMVEPGQTATDDGAKQKDWVDTIVEEFFTFEVAYIGQSFGDNGSKKAIDRLTGGHQTVIKALSNIQDFARNRSVGFITINQQPKSIYTRIDTTRGVVDPIRPAAKFLAERFNDFYEPLSETTVNAAEAALISAFKPRFNVKLVNFPQPDTNVVKELKKQGYTHLQVAIELRDALAKLKGPKTGKPSSQHSWTFNLDTGDLEGPENLAWGKLNTGN